MARQRNTGIMIKAGDSFLPDPSDFEISAHDIWDEGTGRDLNGIMQGNIIRYGVHTFDIEWRALSMAGARSIMNMLTRNTSTKSQWITVKIVTPESESSSGIGTYECYLGDRTYPVIWWPDDSRRLVDLHIQLIER